MWDSCLQCFRVALTKGMHALVDACDVASVVQYKWRFQSKNAYRNVARRDVGTRVVLQTLSHFVASLMGLDLGVGKCKVRHLNGNVLDCRRSNIESGKRPIAWDDELQCFKVPLTQGMFALVDREDVEWAAQHNWHVQRRSTSGNHQAAACGRSMHREIARRMGLEIDGFEIDHKNQRPLDNRRLNLRVATRPENIRNRKAQANNKQGLKGVHQRSGGMYVAQIKSGHGYHYLGQYATASEAAEAYDAKAAQIHGRFACTNSNRRA